MPPRAGRTAGPSARSVLASVRAGIAKGWPAGLTVLTGDDVYHLDAAQKLLLGHLVPQDSSDFALSIVGESRIAVPDVVAAARSRPMFALRRVVLVRDVAMLDGEGASLEAYAGAPPEASYLIVRAPKLDLRRLAPPGDRALRAPARVPPPGAVGPAGGGGRDRGDRGGARDRPRPGGRDVPQRRSRRRPAPGRAGDREARRVGGRGPGTQDRHPRGRTFRLRVRRAHGRLGGGRRAPGAGSRARRSRRCGAWSRRGASRSDPAGRARLEGADASPGEGDAGVGRLPGGDHDHAPGLEPRQRAPRCADEVLDRRAARVSGAPSRRRPRAQEPWARPAAPCSSPSSLDLTGRQAPPAREAGP